MGKRGADSVFRDSPEAASKVFKKLGHKTCAFRASLYCWVGSARRVLRLDVEIYIGIGPITLRRSIICAIEECSVPLLVCIDAFPAFVRASTVDTDNEMGMQLITKHLIAREAEAPVFERLSPELAINDLNEEFVT